MKASRRERVNHKTLLIRADANVAMGTGHVMRCIALAQAWQDAGGRCVFAMAESTPAVERRLLEEGVEIKHIAATPGTEDDAKQTCYLAGQIGAAWIASDGYQFGSAYQLAIKAAGLKLLFVDDNGHAEHYSADLVLNQNVHASADLYPSLGASTRMLLGPRYALLRREFATWQGWKREIPATARNVLVTMGGSDPDNFTQKAVEGLQAVKEENLRIRVLVGGSNPHFASLEKLRTVSGNGIQLVRDATDMPEQMRWADLAVAGAGSACLEMCLMGLPALLIDLAENQTPIANEFGRRGTARHLGNSKTVTLDQIERETRQLRVSATERSFMSERGRELVDGSGAERVVRELLIS